MDLEAPAYTDAHARDTVYQQVKTAGTRVTHFPISIHKVCTPIPGIQIMEDESKWSVHEAPKECSLVDSVFLKLVRIILPSFGPRYTPMRRLVTLDNMARYQIEWRCSIRKCGAPLYLSCFTII